MDIVFPESTGRLPQPRHWTVRLRHILALVYAFGGTSALVALLSKFVISPLVEQLTFDRRLFADAMRVQLASLNSTISRQLSRVPPVEYMDRGLVDVQVQSSPEALRPSWKASVATPAWDVEKLRAFELDVSQLYGGGINVSNESMLVSQCEEIDRQMRQRFHSSTGSSYAEFKKVIRSVKGTLLSY